MKIDLSILKAVFSTAKELLDSKRASATGAGVGAIVSTGDWRQDLMIAILVAIYTLAQTYLDSRKSAASGGSP